MSTSPAPRSPGSGSTRQLLDELDALMQRMLALPVNQLEDDPAPPANAVTVPATTLTVEEAPVRDLAPEPAEPPETERLRPDAVETPAGRRLIAHPPASFLPGPHTPEEPAAPRPAVRHVPPPDEPPVLVPPAPRSPPPVKVASVSAPPAVRRSPMPAEFAPPEPLPPRLPLWQRVRVPDWAWRTLLWSNRTFDRSTRWLGNPGRWLRSPRGRTVLGWLGLVLWSVALALGLLRLIG